MKRIFVFFLVFLLVKVSFSQSCKSNNQWTWDTHSKWFMGDGYVMDHFNDTNPSFVLVDSLALSFEGTSSPSNERGELLFLTNGIQAWNASGALIHENFTAGNESDKTSTSAVQGVFVLRHPSQKNIYHVFCTDDVLSTSDLGLDYFKVDENGTILTGPQKIVEGRMFEGLAATFHSNGQDVWLMSQSADSGRFNSFLIDENGLNLIPVHSEVGKSFEDMGGNINANFTRGALDFSWDGSKLAQGHSAFWPIGDQEVTIYNFDNFTGEISNPLYVSNLSTNEEVYDIEFSPDNNLLYVSTRYGSIGYYDLQSDSAETIRDSYTVVDTVGDFNFNGSETMIKLGPDGKLYLNCKTTSKLMRSKKIIDKNPLFEYVPNSPDFYNTMSMPSMFIPPLDRAKISSPINEIYMEDLPITLYAESECSQKPIENSIWSISQQGCTCEVDSLTGQFNASEAGDYFVVVNAVGALPDTLFFSVLDTATVTSRFELKDKYMSFYPNPTNDIVSFSKSFTIEQITIIDITGRNVLESISFKNNSINLVQLPIGSYHITLRTKEGEVFRDILVKK